MSQLPPILSPAEITRREALKRAALLLGAAISPSLVAQALGAAPVPAGPVAPAGLSPAQLATMGALAERILPRTDTPGALDAGVPAYADTMFQGYLTEDEKSRLASGLGLFDEQDIARGAASFAALPGDGQDALIMEAAESKARPITAQLRQIRELTIVGYFTSELVGKNVLNFNPFPGPYRGCVPLTESGGRNSSGTGR